MNTFKTLGVVGSGILLLSQIVQLVQAAYSGYFEYWEIGTYINAALITFGYAMLMVAFLLFPTAAPLNNQGEVRPSQSATGPDVVIPSVGQWLGWILLLGLPLVGFVMMIVWLTDKSNPIRRNFVLANLILLGIVFVFYLLAMGVFLLSEFA